MNGPLHPDDLPGDAVDAAADPIDELLRARLQAGAPAAASAPEARSELAELTPRFRRARQRRQVAVAALSSAAAVVLVVVGLTAFGDEGSQRIDSAGDDTSTSVTTSSSTSTTSTTVAPPTTTAPTSTSVPSAPTTTAPAPSGAASTTTSASPRPTVAPSTVAPTTPVGGTETLAATGGTATVRWTATSATVLGATPAPGWSVERTEQKSATRVEVRFRRDDGGSGSSSSTIDARVVDGRLVVDAS
jgi:hypothetical protein